MLPTIKALSLLGHEIWLKIETDFPTADLFARCAYVAGVLRSDQRPIGQMLCGQWRPASWGRTVGIKQYQNPYPYRMSEWASNFRLAQDMGWQGEVPDCSDWCRDLDRTPRWDVGIVPGSKNGVWLRKRYPGMAQVAQSYLDQGKSVAVFGLQSDGIAEIPGEKVSTDLPKVPDMLAGCKEVIGTDSGVTHLAASLGIQTTVIYTATSEIKGDPVRPSRKVLLNLPCRPCQSISRWHQCRDWKCQTINPDLIAQPVEVN